MKATLKKGRKSHAATQRELVKAVSELRKRLHEAKASLQVVARAGSQFQRFKPLKLRDRLEKILAYPDRKAGLTISDMQDIIRAAEIAKQCVPELIAFATDRPLSRRAE